MSVEVEILEANPEDAHEIAEIHLSARHEAMPYLSRNHLDAEIRELFTSTVGDPPSAWWVARRDGQIVGYMLIYGEDLDHLYVRPTYQGHGIGTALLQKAKVLSVQRLALSTFQKNTRARLFYEARGFHAVSCTDGHNEENEPDVQYVWEASR